MKSHSNGKKQKKRKLGRWLGRGSEKGLRWWTRNAWGVHALNKGQTNKVVLDGNRNARGQLTANPKRPNTSATGKTPA